MTTQLSEYKKMNVLRKEICLNIYDSIMISMQELKLTGDVNVMKYATSVFQILTITDNPSISQATYIQPNISQNITEHAYSSNTHPKQQEQQNKLEFFEQNQVQPITSKDFKTVAEEWLEYKKSLTIKTDENPKPLSPKTVAGYNKTLVAIIIPYFEKNKNISIITEQKQKKLFKTYRRKWDEDCYMFLNQYRQPFVPENLSKPMRKIIGKYKLEPMTPYGLRHSFATFCSEQGMEEIVLMRLMGHSDFNTTQKYYIVISSKRKKQAMQQVYKNIFEKETRNEKIA